MFFAGAKVDSNKSLRSSFWTHFPCCLIVKGLKMWCPPWYYFNLYMRSFMRYFKPLHLPSLLLCKRRLLTYFSLQTSQARTRTWNYSVPTIKGRLPTTCYGITNKKKRHSACSRKRCGSWLRTGSTASCCASRRCACLCNSAFWVNKKDMRMPHRHTFLGTLSSFFYFIPEPAVDWKDSSSSCFIVVQQ